MVNNSKTEIKPVEKSKKAHTKATERVSIVNKYIKEKLHFLTNKPALFLLIIAFTLTLVIEMFARHSVFNAIMFVFRNPVAFLFCVSIISITFIPSLFFKRSYAIIGLISLLWLSMSVTDFIIRFFRITPFSAMDITLLPSVASIIDVYLGIWGIILVIFLILLGIFLVVLMFLKMPKSNVIIKTRSLSACKICIFFGLVMFTAMQSGAIQGKFSNLGSAYDTYGFTYCFSASIFSRGITKPNGYSQAAVEEIDNQLTTTDTSSNNHAAQKNPNIILIQLESYFDANYMNGITFSQNPVPNFTELKEEYPHGYLTVPSLGAGTANTEFEVLTGMNKADFGIGEYPYKTILQENTCESICYNLKESGYTTHAIHNHYGNFYDRNKVFSNLGFDTFTPVECMTYVPTTVEGWEKDEILPKYIDAALSSTEGRDFVFTITVQGHGKYPSSPIEGFTPQITVTDGIDDEAYRTSVEYYINMLYETDKMIGNLTDFYKTYNEPVMIVFYGDHLPNISLTEESIAGGNLLNTEYVIWTNYDLTLKEPILDLRSYQISSYIMELCGKSNGIITNVHQTYMNSTDSSDYEYVLEIIEYDMLYGDNYISDKRREKYQPTDMKIGILDIIITGVDISYDDESGELTNTIHGENFTPWSVVCINGEATRTVFKNSSTLIINDVEVKDGDEITVEQVTQNKMVLFTTDPYIISQTNIKESK